MADQRLTNENRGLKVQVCRQRNAKEFSEKSHVKTSQVLVHAIKEMYCIDVEKAVEIVWRNYKDQPEIWLRMDSRKVGKKSIIKEYINKKGKGHQAHFTQNDKYIGPCSKEGNEPIAYDGYFCFAHDELWVNSDKIPGMNFVEDVLSPKKIRIIKKKPVVVESESEDE